jgi:DNA modification methylase
MTREELLYEIKYLWTSGQWKDIPLITQDPDTSEPCIMDEEGLQDLFEALFEAEDSDEPFPEFLLEQLINAWKTPREKVLDYIEDNRDEIKRMVAEAELDDEDDELLN